MGETEAFLEHLLNFSQSRNRAIQPSGFFLSFPNRSGDRGVTASECALSTHVTSPGRRLMRLLIAEDDRALAMFLMRGMESDGHRVRLATDGAEAVLAFRNEQPDLTILDLNLPVKDGEQVLAEMRLLDAQLPVLVLTARQEVETRIRCFDLGADDLMVKPFSLHELRARCRVLLRRKREAKLMLRAGDLELDRLEHTVRRAGQPISLTNKEFALMEHLMLNRGQCISRVELLDAVWNMEPAQTTNIVDVYVNYLRRKLHDPPPGFLLRTVRGQGYLVPSDAELNLPVTLLIQEQPGSGAPPFGVFPENG
jgi:DNA-binding response OmpR family regulator